jgi:hypothetical protein
MARGHEARKTRETLVDCNTDSEDEHTGLRDPSPNRTEVQQGKLCVSSDPRRADRSRGGETTILSLTELRTINTIKKK